MAVNLDSSFLCASVEIGAVGRLLQYMNELALAEPREPSRMEPAHSSPHAGAPTTQPHGGVSRMPLSCVPHLPG